MLKKLLLMAATVAITAPAFAQATKEEKLKEKGEVNKLPQGWTKKAALGLGGNYIGNFQPAVGGGNDQLALNGIFTAGATYRAGRMVWDNAGALQYGVLKTSPVGVSFSDVPVTKPIDNIQLASKFNYGVAENSVWFYTLASTFRSQITPTYQGGLFEQPKLAPQALANFLAPAYITLTPGMDYKPTENFSVLVSPASLRMIVVSDSKIAELGLIKGAEDGLDLQLGASLTASYKETFLKDKIQFQTGLNLYSNYLAKDPQNVDVEWGTNTKFNIFKGWGLSYNTNLFYDNDRSVVVKDGTSTGVSSKGILLAPAGYRLVPSTTFIHGLFVTYDRTF